jgi:hypothetical protein
MKNISLQYQDLKEGKMTQAQFLRNARMMFPSFVTNHNSYDDSVKILKTKGMLVEGDAVKGAPDKEPTYDSPTPDAKTKYKKVEQSPEVDEQDGVYPATTLTDIPKIKTNKKVKDTSSGLEPIKDKDTKNEMKKVKVVKEGVQNAARGTAKQDITVYAAQQRKIDNASRKGISDDLPSDNNTVGPSHIFNKDTNRLNRDLKRDYPDLKEAKSFDDIFGNFIKTDDATEIKAFIKAKGKEAIAKIKAKLPQLKDQARQKLAKLMKVELDEARFKKGTDIGKPGHGFAKIEKAAEKEYGSKEAGQKVAGAILKKVLNKESDIRERLKPAITKLVQEVLDEMGQE